MSMSERFDVTLDWVTNLPKVRIVDKVNPRCQVPHVPQAARAVSHGRREMAMKVCPADQVASVRIVK